MANIGNKYKKLTTDQKLEKVWKHLKSIHDLLSWEDDVCEFIKQDDANFNAIDKSIEYPKYEIGEKRDAVEIEEYKKTLSIIRRVLTKRFGIHYPSYY